MGTKDEDKSPSSTGDGSDERSAVFGHAHLSHDSLDPLRHDSKDSVSKGSVDAVKEAAGGLPGNKIGIHFQGYGSPGRRRSRGWIPELEVAEDFFDDGRGFDKADDA